MKDSVTFYNLGHNYLIKLFPFENVYEHWITMTTNCVSFPLILDKIWNIFDSKLHWRFDASCQCTLGHEGIPFMFKILCTWCISIGGYSSNQPTEISCFDRNMFSGASNRTQEFSGGENGRFVGKFIVFFCKNRIQSVNRKMHPQINVHRAH